ncbi:hypothetical protein GLGCALEP_01938 [Pseudomonas sp. MM221]|nr:hypothetical protein GLGCALEP_01938 [Pseudomonas sp. MM221]
MTKRKQSTLCLESHVSIAICAHCLQKNAASGRDLKAKRANRLASKLANLLCTPRSAPPYLCVTPERPPVDRVPPT